MSTTTVRHAAPPRRDGIFRDPRLGGVEWRDLVPMSRWEVVRELTLSVPWLAFSIGCYHLAIHRHGAWLAAGLVGAFYVFLTGLRQVHGAHHYSLGVSRRAQDWLMWALSVAMMSSMHAIQVTHLHHHRHCLGPDDVEATPSRLPWHRAVLLGPFFFVRLHVQALRLDRQGRKRGWIALELASIAVAAGLVFLVLRSGALRVHVFAMLAGQCFTGFFAVWTVHHDCDDQHHIGRTQRGWLKNLVSYDMFFHVEHHLFPAVPTCHHAELARRLDAAAPELKERSVF